MNPSKAKEIYEKKIYGRWRDGENVSYKILETTKRSAPDVNEDPFLAMFRLSVDVEGKDVEIYVEKNGKIISYTVRVYEPKNPCKEKFPEGNPFIVCMHPIGPKDFALSNGYGLVFLDTSMVAEDNNKRKGAFYELYPYTENSDSQTGELMAWAWSASKILDAMGKGLAYDFGFNKDLSIITGVSRWGKATAVCGAFENRFRLTVPVCSGAGGLALWNYVSEGKSYDLSFIGGPKKYVYSKNEPLSSLQSLEEQGWFNDDFLKYASVSEIPLDQYWLPLLAAGKKRYYFIVAAWMGEDWVNAPVMWECLNKSRKEYISIG